MSKMTRYAEAKSVKVDNWGVFFLQKLQNFFNKTDHCDLTLQFNDNSQLKVHRLVLSACTDYFNHLENVCEMYEDVLIMPMDLQADVIVPIVNFMYTGTLEFQYNMYDRLLKTATDMNMTVLLKLLEAHRQTSRVAKQPVLLNKQAPRPRPVHMYQGATQRNAPAMRGGMMGARPRLPLVRQPVHSYGNSKAIDPAQVVSKYSHTKDAKSGPSRFDAVEMAEGFEGSFDGITYESKPLLTADQVKKEEETSPFEKLRKGYTNANVVKRASSGSITSPPAKKPNLDEVKEFTEAARLRSQLATDDDESADYVDDDTHFNDDDDEDYHPPASVKAALAKANNQAATKQIVIKQESKSPGSSGVLKQITVKDDSGNVDHAKIISEVLKKYPHLVKKNKNIKLKIMQKPSTSGASAASGSSPSTSSGGAGAKMEIRTATPLKQDMSMVRRATANIRNEPTKSSPSSAATTPGTSATPKPTGTPKTIDAKTMHALIAKGAENMTGPWLCLRCGINGRPISIPSYKAFRNHLIVKHKERIDSRICEHCGWKAEQRNPHLLYHWLTEHGIKSQIKFPTCDECGHVAMTVDDLHKHEDENHTRGDLQQCIYCNKVFAKEMELYDHMKAQHRDRAIADGVLEFTDDEDYQTEEETSSPQAKPSTSTSGGDGKIKILSNITLPPTKGSSSAAVRQITLEPSSEAEALSNVASGIATSLGLVEDPGVMIDDPNFQSQFIEAELASVHGENASSVTQGTSGSTEPGMPKLVTADGTELKLTQSQKDEIISQLQSTGNGNEVVMVLNEDNFTVESTLQLADGVQIVDAASQNIMLMYGNPDAASENNDSHKSDSKADVTASEDENSQASVSLSEDKAALAEGKQPSLGEGEESQESRKTDVTDKPDEEEGNTTDDVDMSGDVTSETNETLQQAVREEMMDVDDGSKGADTSVEAGKETAEESEERQQTDKLKLISELEGDWSEDTAEEQPSTTAASKESEKSAKKPATDKRSPVQAKVAAKAEPTKKPLDSASKKKAANEQNDQKKAASDKLAEKEIDTLLDDWTNETVKAECSDTETDLEKKMEKVTAGADEEGTTRESNSNPSIKKEKQDASVEKNVPVPSAEADVGKKSTAKTAAPSKEADSKEKKNGTKPAEVKRRKADASEPEDEDEDEELDDEDKDKSTSKSKEVSSLLGEWDEDDDL
ncbi:centrosome-associated zinc finger protein CP190 [Anopheles nili]|uniref:centrosome-associated zinc finger protein CP190 n=1 Tax=Anopheles nili TaxID=185578 RepID=UPI00237C004E|nr:centrosome-associated zinc finger protein CP190 [Anopheles nili]